jgi:hypothetical protein
VQQLEVLVRTAIFKPANELIGLLLQQASDRIDSAYHPKPGLHYKGRQSIQVQGIFGSFALQRDYYYDPQKEQGHAPADAALGLEGTYTPALARLMCLEGTEEAFAKAEEHLRETGGIEVSDRQIQRVVGRIGPVAQQWQEREARPEPCHAKIMYVAADGGGVPMRKEELEGRKGKQPDGTAKTRLNYLGCVFTQHKCDKEGRPIRDHESTTYVSSFGDSGEFGLTLRKEALRRGWATVGLLILLIDGASGLEKLGQINFPGCIQIVDFYHALVHLHALLQALWGKEHPDYKKQIGRWIKLLLKDGVKQLVAQAREWSAGKSCAEAVEKELGYFEHNVQRMQYGTFRRLGYFIGSGVIEAGCKTIIGGRCKQSGMRWSETGAGHILTLRCVKHSRTWDQFWKQRANEHAARNDALPLAA